MASNQYRIYDTTFLRYVGNSYPTQAAADAAAALAGFTAGTYRVDQVGDVPAAPQGTLVDLADTNVANPGALAAGVRSRISAPGTYTAPPPAATLAAPPQRFALSNRTAGKITLQHPDSTGAAAAVTVLPGESLTYRQVTLQGYEGESGNKRLTELDARYGLVAQSAALTADVALTSNTVTEVGLVNLTPGLWLVSTTATVTTTNAANVDLLLAPGTATAALAGVLATTARTQAGNYVTLSLDSLVTVTTAGTVRALVQSSAAGTVKFSSQVAAASPATGVVAVRLAPPAT